MLSNLPSPTMCKDTGRHGVAGLGRRVEAANAFAAGGRDWRVLTRTPTNEGLHADSMKQSPGRLRSVCLSIHLCYRPALVLPRVMRATQVIGAGSLEGESNFAVAPIIGRSDIGFEDGTRKLLGPLGGPANADGTNPSRMHLPNHNSMAAWNWGLKLSRNAKAYV